jgi:hypothetical protein
VEPIESNQYSYLIGQVVYSADDNSARITYLAPGDYDHHGFIELLSFLTVKSGEAGAIQVLAEVDEDSLEESILFRAGFRPYAEQQIWKLSRKQNYPQPEKTWIPISRADTGNVISLIQRSIPAQINRVESHPNPNGLRGMVHREQDKLLAAALINYGPIGILIDLILDPGLEKVNDYLTALIHHVPYHNTRDIYFRVRSYQQRIATALESQGAEIGATQKAVVKRLALHYNAKQTFRVQGFENQPDITTPISHTKIEN